MQIKITGLEKKESSTHVILILRGEHAGGGCLMLIKDQTLVKTFMTDVRKCRLFDFEGEMTTFKGHPILNVASYTIVDHSDQKSEIKNNPKDEETPEPKTVTENNIEPVLNNTVESMAEPAMKEHQISKEEINENDPNVNVEIIKYVPVVGIDIKIDSLYFKGYQTLESYLETMGKKIDKTLKFY